MTNTTKNSGYSQTPQIKLGLSHFITIQQETKRDKRYHTELKALNHIIKGEKTSKKNPPKH